jgi:hypothetical protein
MCCKTLYGIKEPVENNSETHGYCEECYRIEIERIRRYQRGRVIIRSMQEKWINMVRGGERG